MNQIRFDSGSNPFHVKHRFETGSNRNGGANDFVERGRDRSVVVARTDRGAPSGDIEDRKAAQWVCGSTMWW